MSDDKRYNGWTNYETWVVKLWMDNDQGEQELYEYQAVECYERAKDDRAYESQTQLERATCLFADSLKDEFEEANPVTGASVWSDLMTAALGEVNWYEIAESILGDCELPKDDESDETAA